ncbi:MAG: UvrD-helicase domain-containing protein, partial [Ilumatobacteraceae bacterium]|nr:UvrD-helicase domain-containing protein [Ilumatobacteraceae bacterium]
MSEQLDLFAAATSTAPPATQFAAHRLPQAPDQADRDLVTGALSTTLFVEAGAGSGKTTALVQRVVNLIMSGVPVGRIAAITFTEKAAAELRHKIRRSLEVAITAGADSPTAQAALAELDQAPIGTLHAFARRLLSEFPVEAQLPPQFGVLDEVQSANAFHERFTDFLETLLDNPDSVRLVELCQHDNFGIDRGGRIMAEDFQANWDLVAERVSSSLPAQVPELKVQAEIAQLCAAVAAFAPPPDDTQVATCADFAERARGLSSPLPLGELLRQLGEVAKMKAKGGDATKWKRYHGSPS